MGKEEEEAREEYYMEITRGSGNGFEWKWMAMDDEQRRTPARLPQDKDTIKLHQQRVAGSWNK